MRSQRSFVVEFKSSRRQPKAQGTSIWGDADLKALAREVEDQAPHIFGPAATTEDQKSTTVIASAPAAVEDPVVEAKAEVAVDEHVPAPSFSTRELTIPSRKRDAVRKTPRRRSKSSPPGDNKASLTPISIEALAALEEENTRLKALWRDQLQAENERLTEMLARFQ